MTPAEIGDYDCDLDLMLMVELEPFLEEWEEAEMCPSEVMAKYFWVWEVMEEVYQREMRKMKM